jgi:geranyl-CoA carboxylase alpha subunit
VIAHGETRVEARRKLIHGLEQTVAFGVTTNQAFLASCLRHDVFAKGGATTAFIGEHAATLLAPRDHGQPPDAVLAALLFYVTDRHAPPWRAGRSLAATYPLAMRLQIESNAHEAEIVRERDGCYVANLGEHSHGLAVEQLDERSIRFRIDGLTESVRFRREGNHLYMLRHGETVAVRDMTRAAPQRTANNGGDGKVRAAMNGRVVAVLVKLGEQVEAGQPVVTLEAMKMEHVHVAAVSGIITELAVEEGEQVTTGRIVAAIETGAGAAS